jgi:hypothetical protein
MRIRFVNEGKYTSGADAVVRWLDLGVCGLLSGASRVVSESRSLKRRGGITVRRFGTKDADVGQTLTHIKIGELSLEVGDEFASALLLVPGFASSSSSSESLRWV